MSIQNFAAYVFCGLLARMSAPKRKKRVVPQREIEIGKRLAFARDLLEISQREFAEGVGITRARLVSYELGSYPLKCDVALSICRRFNISEAWLAEGYDSGLFIHPCLFRDLGSLIDKMRPGMLFSEFYDGVLKSQVTQRLDFLIAHGERPGDYPPVKSKKDARKMLRFLVEDWLETLPWKYIDNLCSEVFLVGNALFTWCRQNRELGLGDRDWDWEDKHTQKLMQLWREEHKARDKMLDKILLTKK